MEVIIMSITQLLGIKYPIFQGGWLRLLCLRW